MSDEFIGPCSEFQEKFLNSDAKIIIAGGAAGSSKSFIGLMRHLRWAEDKYYRGYCIRKNSTALMKSGGLFEQAVDLYSKVYPKTDTSPGVQIKLKDQKIVFPSGASVTFSHYENDKAGQELYQGIEMCGTFYDEAAHAEESHIWWLISRLRTTRSTMKPCIWLSCNPDPDSYLREWVDWWVYPEGHEDAGLPIPERNGVSRWLLRRGNDKIWANTREELIVQYGKKGLDMDHRDQIKPLEVQVLLGTIYDNPVLMEKDPEYLANLESLPEIEMQRLLKGNWNIREKGSTFYDRVWVEEIDHFDYKDVLQTVRTFDFAGTLKSDMNPSPDYTASLLMHSMKDGSYIISDICRARIQPGDYTKFIMDRVKGDPKNTVVYIPLDPGPMAKRAHKLLKSELILEGVNVKTISTNNSKLDRFRPFSAFAQNGGIKILKNCGNDLENEVFANNLFYHKELEAFTGVRKRGENGHDDLVDVTSDAFYVLASKKSINGFATNMSKALEDFRHKSGVV